MIPAGIRHCCVPAVKTLRKKRDRNGSGRAGAKKRIKLLNSRYHAAKAFLNIMNEWYARDTSKKIKAVFRNRMENGLRCSGSIPYGYKFLPGDNQTLHIDEEAAEVVRRIFKMAAEGMSIKAITDTLRQAKVLIPSAYWENKEGLISRNHSYHDPYLWTTTTVVYILQRREYLERVFRKG